MYACVPKTKLLKERGAKNRRMNRKFGPFGHRRQQRYKQFPRKRQMESLNGWWIGARVSILSINSQAILLLGRTGLSRRPEIAEELGKLINVDGNSGTHAQIIKRLVEELGIVSVEKPFQSRGASSGGSNPDIIQLTDRGKLAYRLLSGYGTRTGRIRAPTAGPRFAGTYLAQHRSRRLPPKRGL